MLWDVDGSSWQKRAGQLASRNFTCREWVNYMGEEPYRATFQHLPTEHCAESLGSQ